MNNSALLHGTIITPPVFSHAVKGVNLYQCTIAVKRLSGVEAHVVLLLPEALTPHMTGTVTVHGQLRGYTRQEKEKRRLLLMVLVRSVSDDVPQENNCIELTGELVREPYYRTTPLGREIADLMLKVSRPYTGMDYIPCVVWGRCARFCSHLQKGAKMQVCGRMQSREYRKLTEHGEETRTAYELSIGKLTVLEANAPLQNGHPAVK
jgi:primosomal replication protein N